MKLLRVAMLGSALVLLGPRAFAAPPPAAPTSTTAAAEEAERRRLDAVVKAYEQVEPEASPGHPADAAPSERPLPSFGSQLFQMVLMLGAVVAFAYLVLGKLLPRFFGMSDTGRRAMLAAPSRGVVEVVDRLPLDPRRSLIVVRVGGECFLVGLAGENMTMLSRLDDSEIELPGPATPASNKLANRFQRLLERRQEKEQG
ncbi:MAG: flagellar biosynthetic protein FliO [Myxococcota bacterium]